MAELIWNDAFFSIGGVDLSNRVRQLSLSYSSEILDKTAMGATTRSRIGGFKDWTVAVEWNQDFDAGNVDDTMFPMVGTSQAIVIRPVASSAIGTTNPEYRGNGIVQDYAPVGGAVGEILTTPATIVSDTALTRVTA